MFTEPLDAFFADFSKDVILKLSGGDVTVRGIFSAAETGIHVLDQLNTDRVSFVLLKTADTAGIVQTEDLVVQIESVEYNVLFPLESDGEGISKMFIETVNAG